MTKVIEHGDILLVEVPECSVFRIAKSQNNSTMALFYNKKFQSDFLNNHTLDFKLLPQGNWTILGKADSLNEEQWGKVVIKVFDTPDLYADYTKPNGISYLPVSSATESGHYLLSKYGLSLDNTLILIKKD